MDVLNISPYNPPYLPEVLDNVLRPLENSSRLYRLSVPEAPITVPGPADIIPFDPRRLADDLLPLFQHACAAQSAVTYPSPDRAEAQFLLRRLRPCPWPLTRWLARVDGDPAGFILVQSDYAPALHRANGGRNPLWRIWLRVWAARRSSAIWNGGAYSTSAWYWHTAPVSGVAARLYVWLVDALRRAYSRS